MADWTARLLWRADVDNAELERLHAEAFDHSVTEYDWHRRLHERSLGWDCAYDDTGLVGFVNVVGDGEHAFVLDTMVAARSQRRGIATRLVGAAREHARAAGCHWLHVDFEPHLRDFYLGSCGFTPTDAGLIDLSISDGDDGADGRA